MHVETQGYVYILSNPAMPGILKIGRSKHSGRIRARDIYKQGGTGVPMPFKMEFEIWSEDCIEDEVIVHDELRDARINQSREFFKVSTGKAVEAVIRCVGYQWGIEVSSEPDIIRVCDLPDGFWSQNVFDTCLGAFPDTDPHDVVVASLRKYMGENGVIDSVLNYIKWHDEFGKKYNRDGAFK